MRFGVLGPLSVTRDGHEIDITPLKWRVLLAVLLRQANKPASVDLMMDALWGDQPPRSARANVRVYVHRLRQVLGSEDRIAWIAPGYALTVHPGELDAQRFAELVGQGRHARDAGDLPRAAARLREALGLWRGTAYEGLTEECLSLRDEAARLEELRLTALQERLAIDLDLNRHADLVPELRALIAEHPLRERLRAQLMVALYRSDRQAEALQVYQDTRRVLNEELGLEPGPQLRSLQRAILAADPALSPPSPDPASTCGAARGHGAGRHAARQPPVRQVPAAPPAAAPATFAPPTHASPAPAVPAPAMEAPPAPEPPGRPRGGARRVAYAEFARRDRMVPQQLPQDVPGFTGRDDELAQLDGVLLRNGIRTAAIASVAGTAGVGKTALAVHWAHRVRDDFPDGSLFVDLRGFNPTAQPAQPDEVLERFLRALDVPPAVIPATLEERAALYRTQLSRRRMLIVLDNAASSEQVRWLLPGSASCPVVITSRSRLAGLVARDGARRIPLGLLSQAEAVALLRQVVMPARVDAEPAAAARLTKLCANLPLALRLAGERVSARPHLKLTDLIKELANEYDRLNLLTATDDDATAVRAAFSWSYRALGPDAARTFRLLGLHPGPDLSLEAVSALTGAGAQRARTLLHTLTDGHLLQETSHDRYQLHDLLRAYALDRAHADEPAEERAAAVRRLLDWYQHTADAADRVLMPQRLHVPLDPPEPAVHPSELPSPAAALAWCEGERLNLVAVTRFAAESGRHDVAWKIPCSLWSYFSVRSRWSDWFTTHDIGITAARRGGDRYGESLLLTSVANAYSAVGQYDEALRRFDRAIAISRQIGESWVEAAARTLLGITHRERWQLSEARENCEEALRLFRANSDAWGTAWALYTLGEVCVGLRQDVQALDHTTMALSLFEGIHDQWGRGRALSLIGQINRNLQRFDEATGYCHQAIVAAREIGNRLGEALALYTLGKVQCDTRRTDAARASWQKALVIFEELGTPQADKVRSRLVKLPEPDRRAGR
jgi:DNA-binding SARP family transcriptional activator